MTIAVADPPVVSTTAAPWSKRLHGLDAMRGVAALTVVLWHWQHFSMIGAAPPPEDWQVRAPFYSLLWFFYRSNGAGVDLFFTLSGFVFFWLYDRSIRAGQVSANSFSLLRFSRLYPLHLLTFVIVVVEQLIYRSSHGRDFIYDRDDLLHGVMHLLFVQNWPWEQQLSWNGPTWSVSVEILLYVVFFLVARLRFTARVWFAPLMVVLGLVVFTHFRFVGRGLIGFFMGAIAFQLWERICAWPGARRITLVIIAVTLLLWGLTVLQVGFDTVRSGVEGLSGKLSPHMAPRIHAALVTVFSKTLTLVVMPLTVLSIALHERLFGAPYGRLALLGDVSYSTYLIHFPLQVAFVLLIPLMLPGFDIAHSWIAFLAFFAILIPLSLLSYFALERPAQRWLRKGEFHIRGLGPKA